MLTCFKRVVSLVWMETFIFSGGGVGLHNLGQISSVFLGKEADVVDSSSAGQSIMIWCVFALCSDVSSGMGYLESKNLVHRYVLPCCRLGELLLGELVRC